MALFGKKTEKKSAPAKAATKKAVAAKPAVVGASVSSGISTHVISRPHITEKAGVQNESANIYTFLVTKDSTKHTIAKAIEALYKVTPTKVNIVNLPAKRVFVRGKRGTQSAIKKALVFLKKGDKIEIA